ncbi:MAG: leucine-rich repeat domain-containing protein, partial [Clostridia bacterium]|nr:leucine-rich repeat domain-containing protein [Clostridia bacterium]
MRKVFAVILISVAAAIAVAALSACNKKDGSTAVVANSYDMRAGKYKGRNDIYKVTIEDGVTDIPSNAFEDCKYLIIVEIPASVTKIGYRAFFGCDNLTRISFPANVAEIGEEAFALCYNLASIKVDENDKKYKSENDCLIEKETDTLILGCVN